MSLRYALSLARRLWRQDGARNTWPVRVALFVAASVAVIGLQLLVNVGQAGHRQDALTPEHDASTAATFSWFGVDSQLDSRAVHVVLVYAAEGENPPAAPGTPAFPRPGEAYVSPALKRAIADDPTVARRVPGRIIGEIAPSGLIAPDSLQAVAGTPRPASTFYAADHWGASQPMFAFGAIPVFETRVAVGALLVPSWLLLVGVAAMVEARRLRERCAALAVVGAGPTDLRRLARLTVGLRSLVPTVAGVTAGGAMAGTVAPQGLFGLALFPSLHQLTALAIAVVAGQTALISGVAASAATRAAADPYGTSKTRSPQVRRRPWLVLIGCAGLVGLGSVAASRAATGTVMGPGPAATLVFLGASLAAIVGSAAMTAHVVKAVNARVSPRGALTWWWAWRQAAHDSTEVITQTATLVVLTTVLALTGAVQTVLESDLPAREDQWWSAGLFSATGDQAVTAARAVGSEHDTVLELRTQDSSELWGSCADLQAAYGSVTTPGGQPCVDDTEYGPGGLVITSRISGETGQVTALHEELSGVPTTVHTVDTSHLDAQHVPASAQGTFSLKSRVTDVDEFESSVLAMVPYSDFGVSQGEAGTLVLSAKLRALVMRVALLAALLVGVAQAVVSGSHGATERAERLAARFGAPPRVTADVAAARTVIVAGAGGVAAVIVAMVVAQAYLALGSVYHVDATSLMMSVVVVSGAGALAVALRYLDHRRKPADTANGA